MPNPPYTFGRRVAKLVEEVTDDKKKKLEKQKRPALLIPILRLSDLRLPNRGGRWT